MQIIPCLVRRAALLVLIALPACAAPPTRGIAATPAAVGPEPIVIHDNRGGNVLQMIQRRSELEA